MTIYEKLQQVQTTVRVPKENYNDYGNFKYRNAEDIIQAAKPALSEVGAVIVLTDHVEELAGRYYVVAEAKFIDTADGQSISVESRARESLSRKGMDDAQLTGSCCSYARKYALGGLLLIDDNKDFDDYDNSNDDNKGEPSSKGFINKSQAEQLVALGMRKGVPAQKMLEAYGISTFAELSIEKFNAAMNSLNSRADISVE